MIVDTSAIMSIILDEPEASAFMDALADDPSPLMAGGIWVELAAVGTRGYQGRIFDKLENVMRAAGITIVPTTARQSEIAHRAYRRYGLGTGHPAKLNFGDCFSYALAKESNEPLLFKGDDFTHTDVARAA